MLILSVKLRCVCTAVEFRIAGGEVCLLACLAGWAALETARAVK
jgi:hypothetical protein